MSIYDKIYEFEDEYELNEETKNEANTITQLNYHLIKDVSDYINLEDPWSHDRELVSKIYGLKDCTEAIKRGFSKGFPGAHAFESEQHLAYLKDQKFESVVVPSRWNEYKCLNTAALQEIRRILKGKIKETVIEDIENELKSRIFLSILK